MPVLFPRHHLIWLAALLVAGVAAADPSVVSGVLDGEHTWAGEVRVEGDVWVPPGARLVVASGTRIRFAEALSTRTDPVFWHPGTELAAAGTVEVRGTPQRPVVFGGEGGAAWGGLVAAPGGWLILRNARILDAEEAVLCVAAACTADGVRIARGQYGVVAGPGARLDVRDTEVSSAAVGVLDLGAAAPGWTDRVVVTKAGDADVLRLEAPSRELSVVAVPEARQPRVEYVGEYTVARSETWSGDVVVAGRVTVVPDAVLTLAPGTRVLFRRLDTNRDGLGEGELLVLGGIRSLGEPGRPVVFASAETSPRPGDWDKVSLIASEDPENRFRYTVFRHGVQALHAHFSGFSAEDCLFQDNLRAVQFQESDRAEILRSVFTGNKQALRFRDSTVRVEDSVFFDNLYAVHGFRADLVFRGNTVEGNALGGLLAKESHVVLAGNRFSRNRDGARMKDPGARVRVSGNRFGSAAEDGLSLSRVGGEVVDNRFGRAGLDLVALDRSEVRLTGNRFGPAGRAAVHLQGGGDVDARGNDWGGDPETRIHDRLDEPGLGRVWWEPAARDLEPRVPAAEW